MKGCVAHAPQAGHGGSNMMNRTYLALLVVFGACDRDHQLGLVDPNSLTDASVSTDPSTSQDAPRNVVQAIPTNDWDAAGPLDNVQSWTGYVENYKFASGSDVIKFTFGIDVAGQVFGKIYLGNGTPPLPATDPNVGYPPDHFKNGLGSGRGYLAEGFAYSMASAVYSPRRLQFGIRDAELWEGWCALQTPVPGSDMCVPNWSGGSVPGNPDRSCYQNDPTSGKRVFVDCARMELCFFELMCTCTTTACSPNLSFGATVTFDLAISGTDASGGTTGFVMGQNAHFTKDP
jgi:hypothetical protein